MTQNLNNPQQLVKKSNDYMGRKQARCHLAAFDTSIENRESISE